MQVTADLLGSYFFICQLLLVCSLCILKGIVLTIYGGSAVKKERKLFPVIALAVIVGLIVLTICTAGCAALRSTNSPYVTEKHKKDISVFHADTAIVMLSDIQCRDEEECASIDTAFDNVNTMLTQAAGAHVVLLVAGDLTQEGKDWQIKDYKQKEKRVNADAVYRVCGNHDVKSGLAQCKKLLGRDGLYYKKEIGNIVLIGLSNWHKDAVGNTELQRYLPKDGIAFLEKEGAEALVDKKLLFILTHEKPEGIAWLTDPRSFLFWKKYNPSNVYNSDELKASLSTCTEAVGAEEGISVMYIYGHTHTPPEWPGTVTVNNDILFINTSAMRTTSHIRDTRKFLPSSIVRRIFSSKRKGRGEPSKLDFAIARLFKAIFPWNKHSTARVLFLENGSDIAYLLTRNLSKDEWYDAAYMIKLGVPFQSK